MAKATYVDLKKEIVALHDRFPTLFDSDLFVA
jgi:hypothetical protein